MLPYSYKLLNENKQQIRLLSLLAGSPEDEIQVTLRTERLDNDSPSRIPGYEALSYAWGSEHDPVQIVVVDFATRESGSLIVTKNLAEALRHLRYPHRNRTLWIDAICIDQNNVTEKNSQILRMTSIYNLARQAIVWLGPEDTTSDHATWLLQSMASKAKAEWRGNLLRTAWMIDRYLLRSKRVRACAYTQKDHDAVEAFYRRPWFGRVWVRQEIWQAKSAVLICGRATISWDDFRTSTYVVEHYTDRNRNPDIVLSQSFVHDLRVMDELTTIHPTSNNGYLLYQARKAQCTDPRDRIFAMLGLMEKEDREKWSFEPDYSLSTAKVYEEACFSSMETFGDLNFLRHCSIEHRGIPDLPYWVPDWHHMNDAPVPLMDAMSDHWYNHGCHRSYNQGRVVLHANGIHIDHIKEVIALDGYHERLRFIDAIERIRIITRKVTDEIGPSYVGGGTLARAMTRLFCPGYAIQHYEPYLRGVLQRHDCERTMEIILKDDLTDKECTDPSLIRYLSLSLSELARRSFFVTEKGYIGVGPKACRVGDEVNFLFGCCSPLVMRISNSNQDTINYMIVGESWVDSMMFKEAIYGPMGEEWVKVTKSDGLGRYTQVYRNLETDEEQSNDPRWEILFGEDFVEEMGLEPLSIEEERTLLADEAMKLRGVEPQCFDLI